MKGKETVLKICFITSFISVSVFLMQCSDTTGKTEVAKWQHGRKGAVSITYDDGSINQFRKALPIMNSLNIPGTFFINTGSIPGSQYEGKFIGRPVKDIIKEAKSIPTNKDNFFERASAARFLGYMGAGEYFTKAGGRMDADKPEEAYKIIDELYQKVNKGELEKLPERGKSTGNNDALTWDMAKTFASQGHEFASHMVTHPYVAALDEPNMLYELQKSREEIYNQLGKKHIFSAECPYGTENERAMEYALKEYPALRNRMPEPFLVELNRGSRKSPVNPDMEYVQWQRGATTKTPLPMMKAWVDTTASQNNIWLVLVIHGIDGIGWEALNSNEVQEYFSYIKSKENELWTATFGDVARYMRERMNCDLSSDYSDGKIIVSLKHNLDTGFYNLPLTLKTSVKRGWNEVVVTQDNTSQTIKPFRENGQAVVMYQAMPNAGSIVLTEKK